MKKYIALILCCLLLPVQASAGKKSEGPDKKPPFAGKKPDIVVMTQNQYLGTDFTPIITATPETYPAAAIAALMSIANNNIPERAQALAASIAERKPHLVGLQEMFRFSCIDPAAWPDPGNCAFFAGAFNDHLDLTMAALEDLGADYEVAAVVENLSIDEIVFDPDLPPFPGLPVFLPGDGIPDMFVSILDRDVILARSDVEAQPVAFPCWIAGGAVSEDGCNFGEVAEATLLGNTIRILRGFVGVDAEIGGDNYRFVNTHLEVQFPSDNPFSPLIQAAQASEMLGIMSLTPKLPGTRQIVVGDINSSPDDAPFFTPFPAPADEALPPYMQLSDGTDLFGVPISVPFADTWDLRPGKPAGHTCCQLADLSNAVSMHDERIDVIFAWPQPARVKANVLDNDSDDKTLSGLWPSDHSSVVARLYYED